MTITAPTTQPREKSGPHLRRFARRLAKLVVSAALVSSASAARAEVFYQNPVIAGDHPDPSIIRVGKDYWATCTSSAWGPLFPLLHSKDLVNWEQTGAVLPHRPDWATGDFWAPEISEFDGKFFVYFVGRQHNGRLSVAVATADKPGGPYTDHGPIIAQDDGSIDPAPVADTNGVRYLIWKEDGNSRGQPTPIWLQRLNGDGTKLIDEPHELIRNDAAWEGGVVEGPYILRRNGWFYLFYSGNGCCGVGCNYALGVARSRSLFGPWQKNPANPILAGNETWKCPGHGSIVQDEQGRCFFLYHAYSTKGSVFTGREGMLDEVKFGADDWPTMNNGTGPSVKAVSPFGAVQKVSGAGYSDNFTGENLESGWQWPQQREPVHRLQNGKLRLAVTGRGTNFLAAVLARSTTSPDYAATAVLETGALKPGTAVGLCAFGDAENATGAVWCDGQIITWRRDRGETRQLAQQPAPAAARLFVRLTARHGYHFQLAVSADGENWNPCGDAADSKNLPPWDRSVRVALSVGGIANAEGVFDSFSIQPLAFPVEK
jgi:xylan 1,4-beta-xylosidase